jgi:ABC-type cobalamin transport system permease subunit
MAEGHHDSPLHRVEVSLLLYHGWVFFDLNPGCSVGMVAFSTLFLFNPSDFAFNLVTAVLRALIHLLAHPISVFSTSQASTIYRLIFVIVGQTASSTITFNSCALAGSLLPSIGRRLSLHLTASTHSTSLLYKGKPLCTTFTTWSCTKRTTLSFRSLL